MYASNSPFRGPDRLRVNQHDLYEVEYWTMRFGVTRDQLESALDEVGSMAIDVEDYLRN